MIRYCTPLIIRDLSKKMVFLAGPRQVGKTTLAKQLLTNHYPSGEYFIWDHSDDRQAIRNKQWSSDSELVVFDELHKYRGWKQWIKGVYDTKPNKQQYFVTGSARLDIYQRGGDSLLGRYHYWRLHPLTLDELPADITPQEGLQRLLTLGGFPEPFFSHDEREARRWRSMRFQRILTEDVRDISVLQQLNLLPVFVDCVRERVGGLVVLSNIARDCQIAPKTAANWLSIIEKLYLAFTVYPYTKKIPRAIQKPPKVYFYDNADVPNDRGARIENLVATTLIKRLHFIEDYHGYRCQLHYLRDKEGREVDFVIVIDGKVHELIEVKVSDSSISSALRYYQQHLKPLKTTQLVAELRHSYDKDGIRVISLVDYFQHPPWENLDTV